MQKTITFYVGILNICSVSAHQGRLQENVETNSDNISVNKQVTEQDKEDDSFCVSCVSG